ncbi:MAG: recombinase family protein [Planctomycetaceae bacterium]|nr:recombinase family protein [Planctomycetaceae bacterium]
MSQHLRRLPVCERLNLAKPLRPRTVRRFWRLEFEVATGHRPEDVARRAITTLLIAAVLLVVSVRTSQAAFAEGVAGRDTLTTSLLPQSIDVDFVSGTSSKRAPLISARRRRTRSKAEIEREQRELLEKVRKQVAEIIEEFHARLPRNKAKRIGAIYARYSSRFQSSVPDQVRTMFEVAVREGLFVPSELVFYDLAVRGYRDRRPGFNALQAATITKKFAKLLVFGSSRLFRKAHAAVKFVEEELVGQKMHCFFIQQNIDTETCKKWKMMLSIQAAIDEDGTSMYAENVRAAHQGMFLRMEVCGTLPLGYRGEPIGGLTRRNRPKCKVAIDNDDRPYVRKIFKWWVYDGISMDQIARLLNDDPNAPAPPKSITGIWNHGVVRGILTNARYRGFWEYGKTYSEYQSKKDYLRQLRRDQSLQAAHFSELRIISDRTWYKAQQLLQQEPEKKGRKATKSPPEWRPKIFNGILWCPEHESPLTTFGSKNKFMACRHCRAVVAEKRPLFTQLNRQLATKLVLDKIAELIAGDQELVLRIIEACRKAAADVQQPDPERLAQLKAREVRISRSIDFNRRNPGESEDDQKQTKALILTLSRECTDIRSEIGLLEAARERKAMIPDETAVRGMLGELGKVLATACLPARDDTQARLVRRLMVALTHGRIPLYQQGERKAHRGWLQARFRVFLIGHAVERLTGLTTAVCEGTEVAIDFLPPSDEEAKSEQAWKLAEQGRLIKQIAVEVQCGKDHVKNLLKAAAQRRGLTYIDGRTRRSQLSCKHLTPPVFEQKYAEFVRRVENDELLVEIAAALNLSKWTITKLNKLYCERNGLPWLDGRSRRKSLDHKNRPPPSD